MNNNYHSGKKLSIPFFTNLDIHTLPFRYNNPGVSKPIKNFVKSLRKDRNLTLEELAEKMETTAATIQRHESGNRKLTHQWINRYAEALQCHPSDITDGPGSMMAATNPQEENLLKLLRKMSDKDQDRFLSMAEAYVGGEKTPEKRQK